jgi:predicted PurR-regulated permease PerM
VSLLAIAWTIVAFLVGALVVVLCVVMANLFRVITSTRDLIDGVTKQTVPLLAEVGTTVTLVNHEIGRVDSILATAETATAAVGNVVNVVSTTVTSPLVRLSAFAWGLRKAVGKATEDDSGTTAGTRRRGRRRR